MDDDAIIDGLNTLKLRGMAEAYINQKNNPLFSNMSFRERFAAMLTVELESKSTRRTERLLKESRIANITALQEPLYWDENRGMKEADFRMLCECDWMLDDTPPMLLLTGSAGTGKTFFAEYLGLKAIRKGLTVLVCKWPELVLQIIQAKEARELDRLIRTFRTKKLLIIDDFGLQRITDSVVLHTFQTIVDSRWGQLPMIITSQCPVDKWYELFNEAYVADAVMDRLTARSYRYELKGRSMREKRSLENQPVKKR